MNYLRREKCICRKNPVSGPSKNTGPTAPLLRHDYSYHCPKEESYNPACAILFQSLFFFFLQGTRSSNISVSTKKKDISNNTCSCAEPYTGQFCETSPCDGFPCFPGLNCSLRDNGYECENCPPRFEGNGKTCRVLGAEGKQTIKDNQSMIR